MLGYPILVIASRKNWEGAFKKYEESGLSYHLITPRTNLYGLRFSGVDMSMWPLTERTGRDMLWLEMGVRCRMTEEVWQHHKN